MPCGTLKRLVPAQHKRVSIWNTFLGTKKGVLHAVLPCMLEENTGKTGGSKPIRGVLKMTGALCNTEALHAPPFATPKWVVPLRGKRDASSELHNQAIRFDAWYQREERVALTHRSRRGTQSGHTLDCVVPMRGKRGAHASRRGTQFRPYAELHGTNATKASRSFLKMRGTKSGHFIVIQAF